MSRAVSTRALKLPNWRWAVVTLLCFVSACSDMTPEVDGENGGENLGDRKASGVNCNSRKETGYRSGSAFAISLITVDGKPVEQSTAEAYVKMRDAAARDGIQLRIVSGFRSNSEQRYLYRCYVNCSCNSCNLAARPGYSNHQSGFALDLNTGDWGVYRWLARNGRSFGFHETVPSEDWHWEYLGGGPAGANLCGGSSSGGSSSGGSSSGGTYQVPRDGSCWDAAEALGCGTGQIVNCSASRSCDALWAGDTLACSWAACQSGAGGGGGSGSTGGSCQTWSVPYGGSCWDASIELGCSTSELRNCSAPASGCNLQPGDVLSCGCCP